MLKLKMEEERAKNEKKRKQHQLGGGGGGGGSDSRSNSSRGGSNWNNNNNNNNNNNQSSNGPFMKKSLFMTQRVGSSRSPSTSTFQNSDLQEIHRKDQNPSQSNIFAALEGGDDDEDE